MRACYPVMLHTRASLPFYVYGILAPCRPDLEFYVPGDQNRPRATGQRDAYYHPTVDSSEEPFKWGLPDLDGLRGYVSASSPCHYTLFDILNLLPVHYYCYGSHTPPLLYWAPPLGLACFAPHSSIRFV